MSKFSQYIKEEHYRPNEKEENTIKEDNINDMIEYYGNMSTDQLMSEFLKASKKKKQEGGLSDEECSRLTSALSPYLNDEQKETMLKLLEKSKNV